MKIIKLISFLVFAITISTNAEKVRFDNYKVFTLNIEDDTQLRTLRNLKRTSGLELWQIVSKVGQTVDLLVPPSKSNEFEEMVENLAMKTTLKIENIQDLIDHESPSGYAPGNFSWTDYYTLDEYYAWITAMTKKYKTFLFELQLGSSFEGRGIRGVTLEKNESNPYIFIQANLQGRDWFTTSVTTYILSQLLTSKVADVISLSEDYNWIIFPTLNPDGMKYTQTTNRLWRKTRSLYGDICYGVDLDRNWDYGWSGEDTDYCSSTYAGTRAFSENELYVFIGYLEIFLKDKIKLFINMNSYGQYISYPFSNSETPPENIADLQQIAEVAAAKLKARHGTECIARSASSVDLHSGASLDWYYGSLGVKAAFNYALRDSSGYGFLAPASEIIPAGQEVLDSIVALVAETKVLGYFD